MARKAIPKEIMDLVSQQTLMYGECEEQYVALYTGMVESLKPMDHADYLWLWRYTDATWELIRARSIRAGYLTHLMKDIGQHHATNTRKEVNGYEVLAIMFDEETTSKLEYLDRVIASSQRDCDTILQLMEARHDLFAHRARELKLHELEIERLERAALIAAPALAPDGEREPAE
jgi:hypothetical protein